LAKQWELIEDDPISQEIRFLSFSLKNIALRFDPKYREHW